VMVGSGRPLSRGHILLRNADPVTHPLIFPEYFAEPEPAHRNTKSPSTGRNNLHKKNAALFGRRCGNLMVRAKPALKTRNVGVKNPSGYSNVLDLGFLSVGSFWIIGGYQRCADGGGVGDQGKPVDAMLQGLGKLRGSEPFARLDGEREVPKRPTH
jgi:hypothetical protein